jgi:hypothetical protein
LSSPKQWEDPESDGRRIGAPVAERLEGLDHQLAEVRGDVAVEPERLPADGEKARRDRAAGDARDPIHSREDTELVQPAERAAVEQRRAKAPARERETDPRLDAFATEWHWVPPRATPFRTFGPGRMEQPECHGAGVR